MEWRNFPVDDGQVGVFSERKSAVWVFVFEGVDYTILVHVLIRGFRFSSDAALTGRKNLFYRTCVLVLSRGLSTNLQDFLLP